MHLWRVINDENNKYKTQKKRWMLLNFVISFVHQFIWAKEKGGRKCSCRIRTYNLILLTLWRKIYAIWNLQHTILCHQLIQKAQPLYWHPRDLIMQDKVMYIVHGLNHHFLSSLMIWCEENISNYMPLRYVNLIYIYVLGFFFYVEYLLYKWGYCKICFIFIILYYFLEILCFKVKIKWTN